MSPIEKTVFISYRRKPSSGWPLMIWRDLTQHGYDAFIDYQNLASGDFTQAILGNIKTRAHFLVLLTPFALKRINEPGDWLRREIEAALEHRRNIVPVMLDGLDFSAPSIGKRLIGTVEPLKLKPDFADSYYNRGEARREAGNVKGALADFDEAIRLKPDDPDARNNRAIARRDYGDLDGAEADYSEAIRLKPDYAAAYRNRADLRRLKGDLDGALADFAEAIRLVPEWAEAADLETSARRHDAIS